MRDLGIDLEVFQRALARPAVIDGVGRRVAADVYILKIAGHFVLDFLDGSKLLALPPDMTVRAAQDAVKRLLRQFVVCHRCLSSLCHVDRKLEVFHAAEDLDIGGNKDRTLKGHLFDLVSVPLGSFVLAGAEPCRALCLNVNVCQIVIFPVEHVGARLRQLAEIRVGRSDKQHLIVQIVAVIA